MTPERFRVPCEVCLERGLVPRPASLCDVHSRYVIKEQEAVITLLEAQLVKLKQENSRLRGEESHDMPTL
jgi:hypothetical protein